MGQDCFDKNLLADETGTTRFEIKLGMEIIKHKLKLPVGLKCRDCVIQWRYNAGNSWGTDVDTGRGCIGKGHVCFIFV